MSQPQPVPHRRSAFGTAFMATLGVIACLILLQIAACVALVAVPACAVMGAGAGVAHEMNRRADEEAKTLSKGHSVSSVAVPGAVQADLAPPRLVTAEEFHSVLKGMTYPQIVGVIGTDGQRTDLGGEACYYTWRNADGTSCRIGFEGDVVTTCLEFGLSDTAASVAVESNLNTSAAPAVAQEPAKSDRYVVSSLAQLGGAGDAFTGNLDRAYVVIAKDRDFDAMKAFADGLRRSENGLTRVQFYDAGGPIPNVTMCKTLGDALKAMNMEIYDRSMLAMWNYNGSNKMIRWVVSGQ